VRKAKKKLDENLKSIESKLTGLSNSVINILIKFQNCSLVYK